MTPLQHIAADRVPPTPWRNGGGRTRTLWTWPADSAEDAWQLRVSLADIGADGPFSAFPGVQRWFAVLQGAGVRLQLPAGPQVLGLHSPPLPFDGALAPGCQLVDGPTRDLNLMLRQGAGAADLLDATPGQPWRHAAPWRGLFTTTTLRLQIDDAPAVPVGAWTLVLGQAAAGQRWRIGAARTADTLAEATADTTGNSALPAGARALWLALTPAAHCT